MDPKQTRYQRPPRTRSPKGVEVRKAIGLRLMPDELSRLRRHARASNCSYALFARRMTLAGMSEYEKSIDAANDKVAIRGGRS